MEPLRAFLDLVAHLLSLVQGPEALGDDGRVVDEDVLSSGVGLDEAEPLGVVEPLDRSLLRHRPPLLSRKNAGSEPRNPDTGAPREGTDGRPHLASSAKRKNFVEKFWEILSPAL